MFTRLDRLGKMRALSRCVSRFVPKGNRWCRDSEEVETPAWNTEMATAVPWKGKARKRRCIGKVSRTLVVMGWIEVNVISLSFSPPPSLPSPSPLSISKKLKNLMIKSTHFSKSKPENDDHEEQ